VLTDCIFSDKSIVSNAISRRLQNLSIIYGHGDWVRGSYGESLGSPH